MYKRLLPLFAAVLVAVGCGSDRTPLATEQAAPESPQSFLVFAPRGVAAAKIPSPPSGGTTVSDFFNGDGGFLIVSEPNGPGPGDNLNVLFVVPPDALPAKVDEVLITMDVSGTTLSQLVMAFQPAGLVFDPWAHINLSVGRDLIDLPLTDLVAWHIYDDGTAEQVPFSIVDNNPYHIQIFIKVPGFSRYGMGGGT